MKQENDPKTKKTGRFASRDASMPRADKMKIGALALAGAAVVLVVVLLLLGRLFPQAQPTEPTEPTWPTLAANPYEAEDFRWEGNFIRWTGGDAFVGVDVSSHQKEIDWKAVADSGVDFAMIRVGYRGYDQGGTYVDETFHQNIQGAKEAGLSVGVYFYSQAINVQEAREEAQLVLDTIEDYALDYPVVFDWECIGQEARVYGMTARQVTDCTIAFCQMVEQAGYDAMVYFNQSMARDTFRLRELTDYGFWLAQYADALTFEYQVHMWQYTNAGTVPGIQGEVDLNLYFVK